MSAHTIKPLATATAVSTGGRNGHSETSDGSISVNLSVPKSMGGAGLPNTTTPEHLFAAGYAACFGGALDFAAKQAKQDGSGATITCEVAVGPREGGGFGISVRMNVKMPAVTKEVAQGLVKTAHENICPYSHATRGNIDIAFTVEGSDSTD